MVSYTVVALPWKSSVHCLPIPSSPPAPGNQTFFFSFLTVSMVFLLPEYHRIEIIHYIAFSNWLLSLSNTCYVFFMSFHDLIAHFFLVVNNIPLSDLPLFIYPFTYWRTSEWFPSFSNDEKSRYECICAGFRVNIHFQLIWVNKLIG